MTVKSLSIQDAAYLAGFLDGEGYFACVYREGETVGKFYPRYKITVCQKRDGVLDWIIEVTGVGRIGKRRRRDGSPLSPMLSISGRDNVLGVLEQVVPYMIVRKKDVLRIINGEDITPSRQKAPSREEDRQRDVEGSSTERGRLV